MSNIWRKCLPHFHENPGRLLLNLSKRYSFLRARRTLVAELATYAAKLVVQMFSYAP